MTKISTFARSPKGRRFAEQARRAAKDPKNRARIEQARARFARRGH